MTLHVDLVRSATIPVASVTVTILDQTASTIALMAVPRDSSGNQLTGRVVTWSSSDATIAPIGATTGLVSVGASNGTVTITATCEGITGTMTVTVNGATPVATSLQWIDAAPTLTSIGATANSRAHVMDQFGSVFSPQPTITYTSSDTSKATVTSAGLVTAVANGTATITAASAGLTSITQTATVSQVVASITGVSSTLSALDTDSGTFSPVAKDANNVTVSGVSFSYASSQPSVISVNATTGAWAGQSAGSATITITSGSASFVVTCTITHALGLVASPSSFSGAAGTTQQEAFTLNGVDVTSDVIAYSADETVATISSAPDQPTVGAATGATSSTLSIPVTGTGPYGGTPTTVALEVDENGTGTWVRQTAVAWTVAKTATQAVTATGLTANKSYAGKIRAVTITSAGESYPSSAITSGTTSSASTPPVTSGLVLQLAADTGTDVTTDGAGVGSWADASPTGAVFLQASGAAKPILKLAITPTGLPIVRFSSGTYMTLTAYLAALSSTNSTVFIGLTQSASTSSERHVYSNQDASNGFAQVLSPASSVDAPALRYWNAGVSSAIGSGPARSTTMHAIGVVFNQAAVTGHQQDFYVDGALVNNGGTVVPPQTLGIAQALGTNCASVGGATTGPFDLGFIYQFNRALSSAEITSMSSFIRTKWGTP